MYLIVGLGNPEEEYSNTRHNMGFNVINKLSEEFNIKVNKNKFKGLYGKGKIEEQDVILLKPQTYMNLSGESIKEMGTEKFPRVRIGIGKPEHKGDLINYVIGKIPEEDKKILEKSTDVAKDAVIEIIKNGMDKAMNLFN